MFSLHPHFKSSLHGPFVSWLGRQVFILVTGVRFPYGLQPLKSNKTLLYAYNHHIRQIEGFSFDSTKLGSSPDFAHNTIRAYKSSLNSLTRYLNGTATFSKFQDIKLSKLDYKFTALPGGLRGYDCTYYDVGIYGYWWSSTEYSTSDAFSRYVYYSYSIVLRFGSSKQSGFSVRCLRD